MFLSQRGNYRDLDLGLGKPLGWWVDRGGQLRNLIIAQTARNVEMALGGYLGVVAAGATRTGLKTLTSPRTYRSTEAVGLANASDLVSRQWAQRYARKLGEGLGAKSADGMVATLQSLQRANISEDLAWRIVHNVAGLPMGESLSVTQIAQNRLAYALKTRRGVSGTDVGRDLAKLYLSRRARRILENEDQVAHNFGTQLLLMNAVQKGYLPPETRKVWVTAVDERVCPVCAPMDSVAVGLHEQFTLHPYVGVLSHESHLWVPPAHPNCRCRIVTDRAIQHGIITRTARFSRTPQRRARLVSTLSDLVHDAGPSWNEETG